MRNYLAAILACVLCSSAGLAEDTPARLNLVCLGAGSATKFTQSTVNAWNSDGGYASANVIGNRSVPFGDQVNLWLEGGEGRIRMPPAMLPVLRGGEDGWFKIKSIEISDDEIRGSVAVNIVNNPKLRIDRLTGAISISGKAGDYSGSCQPFDPATAQRKF